MPYGSFGQYGQPRYYENFAPQNPYMFRRYQDSQVDLARANADLAQYKVGQIQQGSSPLLNFARLMAGKYNERGIYNGQGYLNDFFNNYGKKPQVEGVIGNQQANGPDAQLQAQSVNDAGGTLDTGNGISAGVQVAKDAQAMANKQQYLDKFKNSTTGNPNSDSITVTNGVAALGNAGDGIDFDNVGKWDLYRQADEMLKAKGLTAYQRGAVLSQFDNIYAEKRNMFNQRRASDLVGQARQLLRDGKYEEAANLTFDIYKYSPDMAKMVGTYTSAAWNRNLQQKMQNARLASIGGGGRPRTNPAGGVLTNTIPMGGNPWIGMYETDKDGRLVPKKFTLGGSDYADQITNLRAIVENADNKYSPEQVKTAQGKIDEYLNAGPSRTFTMTNPQEQLAAMKFIDDMPLTAKGKLAYAFMHGVNTGPMFRVFAQQLGWTGFQGADYSNPSEDLGAFEEAMAEQNRITGPLDDDVPVTEFQFNPRSIEEQLRLAQIAKNIGL